MSPMSPIPQTPFALRALCMLALSLAPLTGCLAEPGSEIEPELENAERDAFEPAFLPPGADPELDPDASLPTIVGATTVCGRERAPALVMVEPTVTDQHVAPGQALHLDVENHHAASGRAVISVSVLSEHGHPTSPDLVVAPIAGGIGRVTTVDVPVDALGLPTAVLALAGHIEVTTRVVYEDGTDTVVDTALRLSFHPTTGGWQIYDEPTRVERYRGGALSAEALRWAAAHPDVRFGPASVRKVAEGTDWTPTPDPLDEHVPAATTAGDDHDHDAYASPTADPVAATHDHSGPSALAAVDDPDAFSSVKLCLKQSTIYTDAGHGEDSWTFNNSYQRSVAGGFIEVRRNGALLFSGPLGDGIGAGDPGKGCTPTLAGTGTFEILAFSSAVVQGNDIVVDGDIGDMAYFLPDVTVTTSGTHEVGFSTGTFEFNVMAAAAQGLYTHAGGLSGRDFAIHTNADSSYADPSYSNGTAEIYIATGDSQKKFIITHELGHAVGGMATGGRLVDNNCTFSSPSCPGAGSHAMTSQEYSACAIGEGFGHFYAADVWNSHNEDDCAFEYWGAGTPAIDCENGMVDYPQAYMENECDESYAGRGVELDWLRQFWDVHTEGGQPSMNAMLDWMSSAVAWGTTNGYSRLNTAANAVGGSINANWDNRKQHNGVMH